MKKYILLALALSMVFLTGCRKPYDVPEIYDIQPSQTAFLVPLIGETSTQSMFNSEELLEKAKVATKQVQLPHRWLQTGRRGWHGKWIPTAKLIVVERKPETRVWTESPKTGTSTKDDGIAAESRGSISFIARMNAVAQIDSADATKFLFRYNNKPLSSIMDEEIKARVESKFVEECAKRSINEILVQKKEIMDVVRNDVTTYFKDRGITITVLGLKGDLTYLDEKIQEAINAEFKSEKLAAAQAIDNKKNIDMAKAEGEATLTRANGEAQARLVRANAESESNRKIAASITDRLVEYQKIQSWDGKLPQVTGSGGTLVNIK